MDAPWLDIVKHDATYAAWVEVGFDCYILHIKF